MRIDWLTDCLALDIRSNCILTAVYRLCLCRGLLPDWSAAYVDRCCSHTTDDKIIWIISFVAKTFIGLYICCPSHCLWLWTEPSFSLLFGMGRELDWTTLSVAQFRRYYIHYGPQGLIIVVAWFIRSEWVVATAAGYKDLAKDSKLHLLYHQYGQKKRIHFKLDILMIGFARLIEIIGETSRKFCSKLILCIF